MSTSSNCPRYAPEDPALPKPWRGLIDGKTGYLYFWNPETNVTQYERPVAKQSAEQLPPPPPLKSSMVPVSSSVHSQHSSGTSRHGQYRDSREDDFRDAGSRGHHHHQRGGSGLLPQSQPNGVTSGGHGRSSSGLSVEMYRRQQEITVLGDDVPAPFMTFESAGFTPEMMREVHHAGFVEPTPIQAQAWPIVMQSRDIVAIAKTGSGKTLGYLFPGFMHLNRVRNSPKGGPTVLVLAPTRELATQILDEASKFGRSSRISSTCLYGGAPKGPQLRDLDRGVDVVVATPGRLNDILEMRRVSLKQVSYLVLDEADRMLDMGFEPQIRKIVKEIPPRRQTLMFTATWPKEVRKIAADLLVKPAQVNIGSIDVLVANKSITQYVELITPIEKQRRVEQILRSQEPGSKILIFCSTKRMCDQLSRSLSRQFGASAIHGDKSQNERDYVLGQFRSGRSPILVATDVAARGLDIKDVRVVINYDFPTGIEDYVHRIGRTGRAGATGLAYTFFSEQDSKHALDLVKVLEGAGQRVPREIRDMSSRGGGGRGKFRRWASGSGGRSRDSRNDAGYGARSDTGYGGRSDTTYGGRSDTTYAGRSDTTYAGRSDTTTYGGRSDSTTYGARSDTTSYGGRSDTTYGGRSDITHSGRSDVTYSGRSDIGYGGRSERGMQDDGTRGRGVDRDRSDRDRGDTRTGRDTKSTRDRERDVGHGRSRSPITRSRAGVSSRHSRSRSRSRDRGRSPLRRSRSRSRSHSRGRQGTGRQSGSRDHARSPARRSCSPARRSCSPARRSRSSTRRSHSPARRSRSPARRSRSRSRGHQVAARRSRSRSRGRGRSPARRSRSRSQSHGHSHRHLGEVAKRDLSPKDAHMVPSGLSPADARTTNTNGLLHAHCESQHSSPIKDEQEKPRSPTRHASMNDHLPTPMEDIPPSSYDRLPISIDEKPPEYGDLPISMDEKPSEYGHSPTAVDEKPFGYGHSRSMDDKPSGYGHSPSMDDKPSGYGHSPSRDDKPSGYGHSPTSMDDKPPIYDHTPMPMDDKPSGYGRSPIPSDDQPTYDRRLPSSMDDKPSDNGRPSIPLDDQPEYDRSPISRENEPRSPSLPRENGWVEPAQLATQPQSVSTISRDFNDRHSGEMIIPRSVSNLADDEEEGLIPAEEEGMIPVDDEGMIPAEEEGMIPQAGMEV